MNHGHHARTLASAMSAALTLTSVQVDAADPVTDAEIARANRLYDAKERSAAAALAERLLLRDDLAPEDRRMLAELSGAGYRDAYLEAPPSRADPSHLCAALRVLSTYLAEPLADAKTRRLHDEIAALAAGVHPAVQCPPATPVEAPSPVEPTAVAGPVEPVAPAKPAPAAVSPPPPLHADDPDSPQPRELRIAGGVVIGLGGALLGGMIFGLVDQRRLNASVSTIVAEADGRRLTAQEFVDIQGLRSDGVRRRDLAIGAGVAAAVVTAIGAALLVRGRRASAGKRWSVTPLLSPTSAGLRVQLP